MIDYFIEFALIHLLLFAFYKLLLRKETQIALLRGFLLTATILALILPLINIPIGSLIQPINVTESVSSIILPEFSATVENVYQPWYSSISWLNWLYLSIAILVGIRFIMALVRILILYRKSEPYQIYDRSVRNSVGLETIFTFFKWIFIDKNHIDKAKDIVLHEEAHIKFGHSYDMMVLNILAIPFWWVPSIWLTIKELKQLHEYQADEYAIRSNTYKNYVRTLINYNLTKQGLTLTNSFNDTPLTKRLSFMKQFKKKISPWKVVSIILVLSITIYTFSCQTQNITEVDRHVESQMVDGIFQIVENPATFDGGITAFYNFVQSNLVYPDKAKRIGLEGKVFVEFVVGKDGVLTDVRVLRGIGEGCDQEVIRVIMISPPWTPGKQGGQIVRQRMVLPISFKLGNSTATKISTATDVEDERVKLDIQTTDKIFQIVDNPASFNGGIAAFYEYIKNNLIYPDQAKNLGLEGKVFIEFVVGKDGVVTDVKILNGIGAGCDEEAKRVVMNSPAWTPGEQNGHIILQRMVLPITFRNE